MKKSLRPFARPLAAALLAVGLPSARLSAADLTVDGANSPYTVMGSQSYDSVYDGNTGTGVINHSAGTLAVGTSLELGYGSTGVGTYNLSGTGVLTVSNEADIGASGRGDFEQTGGSATYNGFGLMVSHNGSVGTYNFSAGTILVTSNALKVGAFGGSNGTMTQTGGTLTISSGVVFSIADAPGAVGAYTLGGTGQISASGLDAGTGGTGTFTQNAGTFTTNGGQITVSGSAAATQGTYSLNGGTVTTGNISGYFGTSTFHFNGGTLQAAADNTAFVTSLTTADVQAGGATIDTNSHAVTIPQVLLTGTAAGTADGGLSKVGAGTLTLTAANTYTGQTSVTAGTLALPSGGSIGVSGGQASLTVAGTAANAPTLVVSGGSVTAGTVYLGYNPGEAGTITQSAGTVTINGSNNTAQGLFVGYNVNDTGLYTLTGGNLVLNTLSSVGTFGNGTVNQSGGSVTVGGYGLALGLYNGGSGTYNLSGTGSLSGGGVTVGGYDGSGTGLLHQTGGTLNLTQLQIGRNAQGSGAVGTFTLDAGTATVGDVAVGVNTSSTGTVNLNGGTLTTGSVVGEGGTSTFRFNGGTLQASANNTGFFSGITHAYVGVGTGGALINTNNFNVTVASALSPDPANGTTTDGGLTKSGTGILTLSVANTFTGPTAVSAGTLAISANGGLGKGSVTIAANATLTLATGVTAAHNASTGTTLTLAATSTINLNATTPNTVQDTYGAIVIGGVSQTLPGTYGSATSGAAHIFPEFTGNGEVLLNAVPEPGTWALVGVGAVGLGLTLCQRRRAQMA